MATDADTVMTLAEVVAFQFQNPQLDPRGFPGAIPWGESPGKLSDEEITELCDIMTHPPPIYKSYTKPDGVALYAARSCCAKDRVSTTDIEPNANGPGFRVSMNAIGIVFTNIVYTVRALNGQLVAEYEDGPTDQFKVFATNLLEEAASMPKSEADVETARKWALDLHPCISAEGIRLLKSWGYTV